MDGGPQYKDSAIPCFVCNLDQFIIAQKSLASPSEVDLSVHLREKHNVRFSHKILAKSVLDTDLSKKSLSDVEVMAQDFLVILNENTSLKNENSSLKNENTFLKRNLFETETLLKNKTDNLFKSSSEEHKAGRGEFNPEEQIFADNNNLWRSPNDASNAASGEFNLKDQMANDNSWKSTNAVGKIRKGEKNSVYEMRTDTNKIKYAKNSASVGRGKFKPVEQSQSHFPQKDVQAQMSGYSFQAEIPTTAHQDMESQAGGKILTSTNQNMELEAGGKILMSTNQNMELQAGGKILTSTHQNMEVQARGKILTSTNQNMELEAGGKILTSTNQNMELQAGGKILTSTHPNMELEAGGKILTSTHPNVELEAGGKILTSTHPNMELEAGGKISMSPHPNMELKVGDAEIPRSTHQNMERQVGGEKPKPNICVYSLTPDQKLERAKATLKEWSTKLELSQRNLQRHIDDAENLKGKELEEKMRKLEKYKDIHSKLKEKLNPLIKRLNETLISRAQTDSEFCELLEEIKHNNREVRFTQSRLLNVPKDDADSESDTDENIGQQINYDPPSAPPRDHPGVPRLTRVICSKCNKMFKNKKIYDQHKKEHDSHSQFFSCTICPQVFTNAATLLVHQKRHNGGLGLKECRFCDYKSKQASVLLMHMRSIHTKEKLFTCGNCLQTFSTYAALGGHMKKHEDVTKNHCGECKRFYNRRSGHKCKMENAS